MSLTAADLAAYIGAASWLPQIAGWIHGWWAKPIITIVADRTAELGFTRLGPILNIRMALSAERKDAIIDAFEATLTHEDGDQRRLRWAGMSETFSEITDGLGNKQVVSRETTVAFKIGTDALLEKYVRFQEPRFSEQSQAVTNDLVSHFTFLRNNKPETFVQETLSSKQFRDTLDTIRRGYWWKPGLYTVSFSMQATERIVLRHNTYVFSLSAIDVDAMNQNLATLETDLINTVNSNLPDPTYLPVNWLWRYVSILRKAA